MPNEVYYILLAAKSGEAHKVDREIKLYPSRDAAVQDAIDLRAANPDQHYLVEGPHTKDRLNWQAREQARLDDGTHTPLILELAQHCKPGHFAHVAKGDPRSLAYTKNEADGIRDIQKRMNVSAYLEAYAPTLDSFMRSELQRLHQNMAAETELLIATDGDEIQEVYQEHNGEGGVGSSCMRHDTDEFSGSQHPVQAYGDSDLAVAYTKDERGRTTARAIIWPAKRCYSRMYGGDKYLPELKRLMMAAGYKPSRGYYGHCSDASEHSLNGARLRAIKDENERGRYIVPYLDECLAGVLDDAKEWITLHNEAPAGAKTISIKETSGVSYVTGPRCPSCRTTSTGDAPFVPAFTTYPADEGQVSRHCSCCVSNYTFVCAGTGQRYNSNQVVRVVAGGQVYVRAWAAVNLPVCGCCGGFNRPEQLLPYRSSLDAKLTKVCPSCASDYAFWCEDTGMLTSNDLRVRALDVRARKRVMFGDVAKLIDRGYSILSKRAAADPVWGELHTIALAEVEHGPVPLCQINIHTGAPVTNSAGRSVEQYLGVVSALRMVRVGYKPVHWTQGIEDLIPHVGDWVKVFDALNFPEADGCVSLIISESGHPTHPFTVVLTDGREAFCMAGDLAKVPREEWDALSVMPRTAPHIGETVMFNHYLSPRFGQRGVVEKFDMEGPLSGGPMLTVRFPDGATRRAAPVRLQRIGPEVMPDPTLPMDLPVPMQPSNVTYRPPHVWQVGDRVVLLPNCVEVSIPSREIGQEAVVISIEGGLPRHVRMDTGHASTGDNWHVRPNMVELIEAVASVEAAE